MWPEYQKNHAKNQNFNSLNRFLPFTADDRPDMFVSCRQEKTPKLWAFLLGTFWVSIVTYYVLVKNYKHMIHLRGKQQSHEKAGPQNYACLVRDIPSPPKNMRRAQQVDAFFRKLHPDTYDSCMIVTNLKKVEILSPKTLEKSISACLGYIWSVGFYLNNDVDSES